MGEASVSSGDERAIDSRCAPAGFTWRHGLHVGFALVGVVALVLMVRHVGGDALLAILGRSAGWLPVLLALELARVGADVATARALYGSLERRPPLMALIRVHLIAYPITILAPAGRAAAEAVKARALAAHTGGPQAAAVGTMSQALALIAAGLIAIPCGVAAWLVTGPSLLTLAIGVQVVVATTLGLVVQLATRRREIGGMLLKRFARAGQATTAYQDAVHQHALVPACALPAALANRALQVVQYGVLVHAVGGVTGVAAAFIAEGINLVGTSLGDFVPGQIGATDGAFALAAQALQLTQADGIGISVLAHAVQIAGVVAGCLVPLLWRPVAPAQDAEGDQARAAVSM